MVERINDLVMKQGRDGKLFAVWVVANQDFRSELKTLFALYARRNDKEEFKAYLNTHEECKRIDEERRW